jgi:hypothetical protein
MIKFRAALTAVLFATPLLLTAGPAAADPPADTAAPVVTSTGLHDGQLVGILQTIRPELTDAAAVSRMDLLIDGVLSRSYEAARWTGKFTLVPSAALNDLDADITVRAWDAVGDHSDATTRVHVDTDRPHAAVTPPLYSFISGVVTFTVTDASDDIASVAVYHDDDQGALLAETTAAPWTMTWNTTGRDGAVTLEYRVTDKAGNTSSTRGFQTIDNTGPKFQRLQFPKLDGRVGGHTTLTAQFLSPNSTIDRVEWRIDGVLRATAVNAPYTLDWDTGTTNRTATVKRAPTTSTASVAPAANRSSSTTRPRPSPRSNPATKP